MAPTIEIDSFDGGITDDYLNCRPNQYKEANNFVVGTDKLLYMRNGTSVYGLSDSTYRPFQSRINSLVSFQDILFAHSKNSISYLSNGAWTDLLGPTLNKPFVNNLTSYFSSFARYKDHLLVTDDSLSQAPLKIFNDSVDGVRAVTAGLPGVVLVSCIEMANGLKSAINAHMLQVPTTHTNVDVNLITEQDAYDLSSLITLITQMVVYFQDHSTDAEDNAGGSYHYGRQAIANLLTSTEAPETLTDCQTLLADLQTKFNSHKNDTTAHLTVFPAADSSFTTAPSVSGSGSGQSFIYTILPYYTYKVNGVIYQDYGPTYEMESGDVGDPSSNLIGILGIPTINNALKLNYDVVDIEWHVYRTANGGTTHYFYYSVPNGTQSFSILLADSTLITRSQIYTAGGVLDNDPPPPSKFIVVANDIAWYMHVKEASQTKANRIRPSVKYDLDSCPESIYVDVDGDIVGGSDIDIYPIVFCDNGNIERLEGTRDFTGGGSVTPRRIATNVVLVNNRSIAKVPDGLFFVATTGIYFTNGFKALKVSDLITDRFLELVKTSGQLSSVTGTFDPSTNRVVWAFQKEDGSRDNDFLLSLELSFGLRPAAGISGGFEATFTTITPEKDSWKMTAMCIDENEDFIFADNRGYLFKFDPEKSTDPIVDESISPSLWATATVVWTYEGPAFGAPKTVNKIAKGIGLVCQNKTNASVQVSLNYDDTGFVDVGEMRFLSQLNWLDPTGPEWRSTSLLNPEVGPNWKDFSLNRARRRTLSNPVRFLTVQVKITNAHTNIFKSDDYGPGSLNSTTKQITTVGTLALPRDCFGYFISFDEDSYVNEFKVKDFVDGNVVEFFDPLNQTVTKNPAKWVMRGQKKGERLNLLAYSLDVEELSGQLDPYRGVEGGNA